ncbi:MAG: TonB-dependent receptor [Cyclobacteriaceae bacterium]
MTKLSFSIVFSFFFALSSPAQQLTQTVRGRVLDKVSQTTLPGASVIILGSDPLIGTTTDYDGNFKLTNIPVGNITLSVSFVGYKDFILPNVIVNSGKEVVLNIPIEEDITQMDEIVVTPDVEKDKPLNDMAVVSARTFSVEETRKFAAAINDPSRMVTSFAGVVQTDDGNNNISIRGNSPYGLLWRMEGIDIPNPNHFTNVATSGGGVSILSSQLLTNSDFMTGAFPAEYGNALAGVFDLNLRKGNNERKEYTVQGSFLGTDVAAEGPFAKGYRGSYLVNYRYSTLSILSNLGLEVGDGVTNFQDLSYHLFLPTNKLGSFSLFGFGGLSDQKDDGVSDSTKWESESDRYNSTYISNTGAAGIKHQLNIGDNTYLKSSVMLSGSDLGYEEFRLDDTYSPRLQDNEHYVNKKITVSSVITHKVNAKNNFRSGAYFNRYYYSLIQEALDKETSLIKKNLDSKGDVSTIQLFSQWNYRASEKLTLNAGAHFLSLTSNNTWSLEPRVSAKYSLDEKQSLSLGYGLHSQIQPVGIYETEITATDGSVTKPNQNIGLNKSHHFVVAYDKSISQFTRLKAEAYYQRLFNIAVEDDPTSSISTLVIEGGYFTEPLVNRGVGRNYGLELTLEKFFHNNSYFLISSSLYDSKYRALDNVWRNSRFNGNFALAITGGKEYKWAKQRTFGLNMRATYAGGLRTTPIDLQRSIALGETRVIESQAFSEQLPNYFRADLRLSLKRNRPKSTSTLALDFLNATNHQNVGGQYFDVDSGNIEKWYQMTFIPVLSYRIEF